MVCYNLKIWIKYVRQSYWQEENVYLKLQIIAVIPVYYINILTGINSYQLKLQ